MKPVIVALDLGTTTGWAVHARGVVTSGTIDFKPSRYAGGGERYLRFTRWLVELLENTRPLELVYEEVRRHRGVDAAHVYGGFLAHLGAVCEERQVPFTGVPVGTIKKFWCGTGRVKKDEMLAEARYRGYSPADDNEADALALLHYRMDSVGDITDHTDSIEDLID